MTKIEVTVQKRKMLCIVAAAGPAGLGMECSCPCYGEFCRVVDIIERNCIFWPFKWEMSD